MKYNDDLFNLSDEAFNMIKSNDVSQKETILRKQEKLLKILFTKFKEQLESEKDDNKGVLKVKFKCPFWQKEDLGYNEIDKLVKSNNFDYFAREYCIYLGDVEHNFNEYTTAYYEVIWDYKTYFEQLKNSKIRKDGIRELCKTNGHDFGNWEEINLIPNGTPIPMEPMLRWRRTCNRCGFVEQRKQKPNEVEEQEIKEEIERLQKKLDAKKLVKKPRNNK